MSHISTLDLHKLRYGELDRARSAELRSHVDACTECKARLQAQQAMRAEFEVLPVPLAIKQASSARRAPRWLWGVVPAMLAAALALVVVLPDRSENAIDSSAVDDIRYKSAGSIELLLEGTGVVDPESTRFHAGDRIQVRVAPGPWEQAWVTDGRDVLGTFPVEKGKATLAPFSLTIDEEPGPEHLVVVVAKQVLDGPQIEKILSGERMAGTQTTSLTLRK